MDLVVLTRVHLLYLSPRNLHVVDPYGPFMYLELFYISISWIIISAFPSERYILMVQRTKISQWWGKLQFNSIFLSSVVCVLLIIFFFSLVFFFKLHTNTWIMLSCNSELTCTLDWTRANLDFTGASYAHCWLWSKGQKNLPTMRTISLQIDLCKLTVWMMSRLWCNFNYCLIMWFRSQMTGLLMTS